MSLRTAFQLGTVSLAILVVARCPARAGDVMQADFAGRTPTSSVNHAGYHVPDHCAPNGPGCRDDDGTLDYRFWGRWGVLGYCLDCVHDSLAYGTQQYRLRNYNQWQACQGFWAMQTQQYRFRNRATHEALKGHTAYPVCPPLCAPQFGYYQTCWNVFPEACDRCPPVIAPTALPPGLYASPAIPPGSDAFPPAPQPVPPAEPRLDYDESQPNQPSPTDLLPPPAEPTTSLPELLLPTAGD